MDATDKPFAPSSAEHLLRPLKSLAGPFVDANLDTLPDDPRQAFLIWLQAAIALDLPEPHAMTLSTVDGAGAPDARVLILKGLDERGWQFATSALGPKGQQIAANPQAALTFYWQPLGRQLRLRGRVLALDAAQSAADFRARSIDARAVALSGRQSLAAASGGEITRRLAALRQELEQSPDMAAPHWQLYALDPDSVEFWQGASNRQHLRRRYLRSPAGIWHSERLWP